MRGRALIVDDEQSMCEMIEADLKLRGFETTWFTSGEEALRELTERDFDVVLTDLKMPGLGGIELCEHVTANRLHVLDAVGRNKTLAARVLGLDRKTLYRKIRQYDAE